MAAPVLKNAVPAVLCIVLLSYAAHTLSRHPCLGVADIGDFWRVARPAGVEHLEPLTQPGELVRCTFKLTSADLASGFSSTSLLVWIARHLRWLGGAPPGFMAIRQMGLLYLALIAAFVASALAGRMPLAVVAALLYVIVDPGYLLFFNSFYGDPAHLVALVGLFVWGWRWGALPQEFWSLSPARWALSAAALIGLVFVGGAAKMQFILLPAVVLAVLVVPLVVHGRKAPLRASILGGSLIALAVWIPLHFYVGPGPSFPWVNNYHAVYGGILRVTDDREGVLRDLGISERYWRLPRRSVFAAGVGRDHPVHQQLGDLSRWWLLGRYLREPKAILRVAGHIQRVHATLESHPRATVARDPRQPTQRTYETWWQFSRIRSGVLGSWPPLLWFLIAGSLLWLAAALRRGRWAGATSTATFLLVWVFSQWIVVTLGEGLITFKQHLVPARLAIDLLLIVVVSDLVRASIERRRPSTNAGA